MVLLWSTSEENDRGRDGRRQSPKKRVLGVKCKNRKEGRGRRQTTALMTTKYGRRERHLERKVRRKICNHTRMGETFVACRTRHFPTSLPPTVAACLTRVCTVGTEPISEGFFPSVRYFFPSSTRHRSPRHPWILRVAMLLVLAHM